MNEKFYITTAIVYASQKPHIGNIYEAILTDAIARYKRMCGYDVHFLTGTDEHGMKIQESAEKKNLTPKEYVDEMCTDIKSIWKLYNISNDDFIRTTDKKHIKTVQKIFKKLYDQGDIYLGSYEGHYCTPCESFWTETQLEDGKCPSCGRECTQAKEEAYFLKLSNYVDRLVAHYDENPDFIVPEFRKTEMLNNFINPGLQDLCVSRSSFTWGVPVDFTPGHVVYVWLDALSNYITALGYDPENPSDEYKKYWPCDVHVIGKDIMRFHSIYWPIMLLALGEPLPKTILGHPWFLFGNDKMSKSKGNVLYGEDLAEKFGTDAVRYFLLSEMSFTNDASISYSGIIARTNSDLANTLGNLVARTAAMIKQYFGGIIPDCTERGSEHDIALSRAAADAVVKYREAMDLYHVSDAASYAVSFLKSCNKYIDETTPWLLAKDETRKQELGNVLYNLVEGIRIASILFAPFIPETCEKITAIFSFEDNKTIKDIYSGRVKPGTQVGECPILFARIDEKKFMAEHGLSENGKKDEPKKQEKKEEKKEQKEPAEVKEIKIDDFYRVKLTVGEVLECEKIEGSDKLLRFIVDMGTEKRQIVSGIAKFYEPEVLIGKKVAVVANLKKAVIRGVESNGMILSAEHEGKLTVLMLDSSIENGSEIG